MQERIRPGQVAEEIFSNPGFVDASRPDLGLPFSVRLVIEL